LNDNNFIDDNDNVLNTSNIDVGINDHFIIPLNIYNPRNYGILNAKTRNIVIEKVPIVELNTTYRHTF